MKYYNLFKLPLIGVAFIATMFLLASASRHGRETAPSMTMCLNMDASVCSYGSTCVSGSTQCVSNPCSSNCNNSR